MEQVTPEPNRIPLSAAAAGTPFAQFPNQSVLAAQGEFVALVSGLIKALQLLQPTKKRTFWESLQPHIRGGPDATSAGAS